MGVWAVDWINLAQYKVQWWDIVNTIIYKFDVILTCIVVNMWK